MGFFLIGRGRSGGDMRLISDTLFEERQSALDELARISADPDFEHHDAEVFVVDLGTAVPVLLVAAGPGRSSAEKTPDEAAAGDEPADEPVDEAADEAADEAVDEDVVDAAEEAPEEAVEAEAPEEADEELVVESTDEQEAEEAPVEETAGVWEAPADEQPQDADTEPVPLADALKRAAGALESEGIQAPESVGPAAVPASWPWEAGDSAPSDEQPAAGEYVPSPFEEPAIDAEDSLLTAPDPDVDVAAVRPVIMGDYADDGPPPPAPPIDEFEDEAIVEVVSEAPPTDVPPPPIEDEDAIDGGEEVVESDESGIDGILADLETIEEPMSIDDIATMPVASSGPDEGQTRASEESDGADLTCDDCVYVSTCPNKEELEPSSCGNFQWKSV